MATDKCRCFEAVLYPESLPKNWIELLEETHIPVTISPLHDKDVADYETGELKKEHYHVGLRFDGPARISQALAVLEPLGVQFVKPIISSHGWGRYLCHLDSPEKAQYSPKDIRLLNGASCTQERELTKEDRQKILCEILAWIRKNNCFDFSDLVNHAIDNNIIWLNIIIPTSYFYNCYLSSLRNKSK